MSDLIVREADNYLPVMSIQEALDRQGMIREYTAALMVDGEDYGEIPGTNKKKVLLKPGAEKLCRIFGLTPRFTDVIVVEDWTGNDHNAEPFLSYTLKCSLYRKDIFMGDADGSCNSWEKKYRYIKTDRQCPSCGAAAIIKGQDKYGGGWICFDKKGGCKAKWSDNSDQGRAFSTQTQGVKPDPDVADKANTLRKMAQKRALVAACLIVVGASEFFTQDVEPESHQQPPRRTDNNTVEAQYVDRETGEIMDAAPKPQTKADAASALKTVLAFAGYTGPIKPFCAAFTPGVAPETWTAAMFMAAADADDAILQVAIASLAPKPETVAEPEPQPQPRPLVFASPDPAAQYAAIVGEAVEETVEDHE
jgi:hypothetical protein